MNIKFKARNQITIPEEISKAFKLKEGDILDIKIENGVMIIQPMDLVKREIKELDEELKNFKTKDYKKYNSGDELMNDILK